MAFGVNYTLGLSYTGNIGLLKRLQHNADGSFALRADQAEYEDLNSDMGNRRHIVKGNFLWDLPNVSASGGVGHVLAAIANDWQLSGVLTAGSAAKYDVTYAYQNGGSSVNLTGSPTYPAMIRIVGDTGSGCSGNQYGQFNVSSFAGPQFNSLGLESGRNLMRGCADHTLDLAIARNIPLGGNRRAQIRADLFNTLNTAVFNGRQSQLQLNSPTDQTVRNPQYLADGTVDPARLTPRNAGFGAVTSAQAMRSVQLQLRFSF